MTVKLKFEILASTTYALILVSLLAVEFELKLTYSAVFSTYVYCTSGTSRPSNLLIHQLLHISMNLHLILLCTYFLISSWKCFIQLEEKINKY